jgi:biotin synthase
VHLRSLQPLGLYVANSIFVGDYLTTPGQSATQDWDTISDMGFVLEAADGSPLRE